MDYLCSTRFRRLVMSRKISAYPQTKCASLSKLEEFTSRVDQDFSRHLVNLPGMLGEIQDYIYGTMIYPTRAGAGIAALITMSLLFQKTVSVDNYGGTSLNWLTIIIAPTGFGKEALIKGITKVYDTVMDTNTSVKTEQHSQMRYQLPASPQKLHKILEKNNSTGFFSDEFAEWLAMTKNNSFRQETLGYIMQAYSKSIGGKITPSESLENDYRPVKNPRISVIATTTGERLLETLNKSQGDSGAYNRMMILPLEQEIPDKKYEGQEYELSESLLNSLKELSLEERIISLPPRAKKMWIELDRRFIEPLKRNDPVLAGRLGEQTVSIAAVLCLSQFRSEISVDDIRMAFDIRLNMYHRTETLLEEHGGIQNATPVVNAAKQVYELLLKNGTMTAARISDRSRQYRALDARDREAVHRYLMRTYGCIIDKSERGAMQLFLPEKGAG
jgi:hypothetical protein